MDKWKLPEHKLGEADLGKVVWSWTSLSEFIEWLEKTAFELTGYVFDDDKLQAFIDNNYGYGERGGMIDDDFAEGHILEYRFWEVFSIVDEACCQDRYYLSTREKPLCAVLMKDERFNNG